MGAKPVKEFSKRFYGTLNAYDGRKRQIPLTEDASTSKKLLRRLQGVEDEKRANGVDRFHDERKRKLADYLDDYLTFLRAKNNTPLHVETQAARIRKLLAAIKATMMDGLDGSRILTTLAVWRSRKVKPMSVGTSNHYLIAIKGFSRWLWTERKSPDDPLAGLRRLNVDAGRRRVRRSLTHDELQRLTIATQTSDRTYRGKDWRLTSTDRTMLYTLAAFTGLRAKELRSLRRSSFDLETKTLTVEASNTKNRKKATLPLHPALVEKLTTFFATLKHDELFPGRWNEHRRAGKFFQRDLKRTEIANVDALGRRVDFHSLRYTFITSLALAGVHPAKAQRLARHSDINLTMGVYTSLNVDDLRDAVASIPLI
jgi:integrase